MSIPFILPKLRIGLQLYLIPNNNDLNRKFFIYDSIFKIWMEISWVWFELLRCWDDTSSEELLEEVSIRGWVQPYELDLISLIQFLQENNWLDIDDSNVENGS